MNFFHALNQGDASLKEPHFTSLLFYIFKETTIYYPSSSFLDFFIDSFIKQTPTTKDCDSFDVETDIKIEEILTDGALRKDLDISIYLRKSEKLTIINIENKINNVAYVPGQIQEQASLLRTNNPYAINIENILLLPYPTNQNLYLDGGINVIYWFAESNSLIERYCEYISTKINENDCDQIHYRFLKNTEDLLLSFANILEQKIFSDINAVRGPRNKYRHSMYEYLEMIRNDWDKIFVDPENVFVKDLLEEFNNRVTSDLLHDDNLNAQEKIARFRKGALEAQPKLMTINERNRIHFGITNSKEKQLFYYPDSPNGNYNGKWKNTRIKPLNRLTENKEYNVFWKNNDSDDIETCIYQNQ